MFVALGTVPAGTAPTLAAVKAAGVPVFAYGNFITIALNFLILAFIIFMMVKQINRLKAEEAAAPVAPPPTPEDVVLLREIRDALKK
jgi:large conductance mechanosensitive channel